MEIQDRILAYIDYKKLNRNSFSNAIGVSPQTIHHIVAGRRTKPGFEILEKIVSTFSDMNSEWLLTGVGKMLKKDTHLNTHLNTHLIKKTPKYSEPTNGPTTVAENKTTYSNGKGVPLIPIEAMAGWGNGDTTVMEYDAQNYNIPEFNELKVDFMIRVKGSSMYPNYNSGDIVACKKLPLDTFFQWNKVYVLDTIQGAMIKRLKKSTQKSHINCFSDNNEYDPFDLALTEVYSLALVVGVIRLE